MTTANTFAPASQTIGVSVKREAIPSHSSIAVIGAGAFGGWTALHLRRQGYKVTLVDAWGPGNSRSSSGDETRVIRSTYGSNETYFDLNVRALELWKEHQQHWNVPLYYNTGALWLCYNEKTPLVDDSIPFSLKHAMPYAYLTIDDLRKRYPFINTSDLHHAFFDPFAGYLKARESCKAACDAFINEGGTFLLASAKPSDIQSGRMTSISLSNGTTLKADAYVFACGSWLGQLFPEILGNKINCTRQEVFYFGVPSDSAHLYENFPVWIDVDGDDFYYGIPGNAHRGFKIGVDRRGEKFDPTNGDRIADPAVLAHARKFIEHRFPSLADAPLIESRVCPYENSLDGNFIVDTHPEAHNVWLVGGGSGHGFKHGPALGELVAKSIAGLRDVPALFNLTRF